MHRKKINVAVSRMFHGEVTVFVCKNSVVEIKATMGQI